MDAIRSMQVFVRVVELGSLSAVARERHTTQPTISKVVAALERDLGVRLLERSTTHLQPTEAGKRFYERAKGVIEEFGAAVADARGLTETPAGTLRVSAPAALGVLRLNRLMQDFLSRWPNVEVEFLLDDRVVDLVEEGIDVALRLGGPLPPNVVARRIAISRRGLVASPAYLSAHRRIRHPRDLADHEYLRFAWASEQLELHGPKHDTHTVGVRGRYRINNSLGIRECLLLGTGIGLAPGWLVQDLVQAGELVRVLPAWQAAPHEAFVVYPSRRYLPARTRAFLDFLCERLPRVVGFEAAV